MFPASRESDEFEIPVADSEMTDLLGMLSQFATHLDRVLGLFEEASDQHAPTVHLANRSEMDALLRAFDFIESWRSRQLMRAIEVEDLEQIESLQQVRCDYRDLETKVKAIAAALK